MADLISQYLPSFSIAHLEDFAVEKNSGETLKINLT